MPPRTTAYFPNPSQQLDFKRFSSDAMLALYKKEHEIIRAAVAKDIPITTNFMRLFPHADYWKWAEEIDVISDDWYPDPSDPDHQIESSLGADLMRSLKLGKPWLLMEQAPSAINWRQVNGPKVNNSYSRWSIQQIAHGADGILHFQWRASLRGAEKWHSGMVPHSGTDTRVWNQVRELGNNLKKLTPVVGSTTKSEIALLLDWNSWWALELDSRPSTLLRQRTFLLDYYRHFFELGYSVDFAHPEQDLSKYKLVIAPNLYLATDKAVSSIRKAISSGVNFVLGAFSIAVDEDEGVRPGGHLIDLRDLFGAYSEEWSPLYADGAVDLVDGSGKLVGKSDGWAEYMRLTPDAEVVLRYNSGALVNLPAVVKKKIGANSTWILSCRPDHGLMKSLLQEILAPTGIAPIEVVGGTGVEVAKRENQTTEFFFLMNNSMADSSAQISKSATDLISGEAFASGSKVSVAAGGWRVLSSPKA
jgi:beta-galactosidase